jgi:hypothetical protein
MASCEPKSLSSASSVDIGSARTTCRPRAGSASGKVPELLCEAALKKLHEHLYSDPVRGTALVFPVFVLYVITIGRVSMTATDAALIALGERFEKLLRVNDASRISNPQVAGSYPFPA